MTDFLDRFSLGIGVGIIAHATTSTTHVIHFWNLILLDALLGPIIEESLFRGCLLPVVARTAGPTIGVAAAAVLFATLHPIGTFVEWLCFATTGSAFGWTRLKSGSTTASTLTHAIYNVALFLCQGLSTTEGACILSRGVLETRVSPRHTLFDALEPAIDSL